MASFGTKYIAHQVNIDQILLFQHAFEFCAPTNTSSFSERTLDSLSLAHVRVHTHARTHALTHARVRLPPSSQTTGAPGCEPLGANLTLTGVPTKISGAHPLSCWEGLEGGQRSTNRPCADASCIISVVFALLSVEPVLSSKPR